MDAQEPAAAWLSQLLRAWANQIAARFNAPVYLVGSALREAKPRDIDIRVVVPDDAFVARYGISATDPFLLGPDDGGDAVRRYWTDVAKLGAFCVRHHAVSANGGAGLNVDFQVQSAAFDALYSAQGELKNGSLCAACGVDHSRRRLLPLHLALPNLEKEHTIEEPPRADRLRCTRRRTTAVLCHVPAREVVCLEGTQNETSAQHRLLPRSPTARGSPNTLNPERSNTMNRRDRETSARLRTFVGLIAGLVFLTAGALNMRGDEPAAHPKLVYANGGGYSTAYLFSAKAGVTETATGGIGDCGDRPAYLYSIAPEVGATYEAGIAQYLCNPKAFDLFDSPANVDAISIVSFNKFPDRSSFALPPIGTVAQGDPSVVGPLVNKGSIHAYITTFASVPTPLRLRVYGGDYLFFPWVEEFTANAKVLNEATGEWFTPPVSQYPITASGVFFVKIEIPSSDVWPQPVYAPVSGFASDGDLNGGTFRAFPFGK